MRAGATPLQTLYLQRIDSFGLDAAGAAFGSALGGDIGGAPAERPLGGRRGLRKLRLDRSGIDDACLAELARAGVFRSTSLEELSVECYGTVSHHHERSAATPKSERSQGKVCWRTSRRPRGTVSGST